MTKIFKDVCGALIERDSKYLVARRLPHDSFGGLWEFPGGAIEEGEGKEEATKREIKEELGVDIEVGKLAYEFEDEIPDLKIHIYLFFCTIINGVPRPLECAEIRWLRLDQMHTVELAPVDKKIVDWLKT